MEAGGFRKVGSGDGCTHEETSVEWYVEANLSPPLWCLGDFRNWEWSTSWSVPWPFRDYFAHQNSYATVPGWTTDVLTAKYYLSPGDVVQLCFSCANTRDASIAAGDVQVTTACAGEVVVGVQGRPTSRSSRQRSARSLRSLAPRCG